MFTKKEEEIKPSLQEEIYEINEVLDDITEEINWLVQKMNQVVARLGLVED